MKSAIAFLALCVLLSAGCAPRQPDPAPDAIRIVSLAPNLTEMVCAVGAGAALVGRTSACDYPPEIIKSVPVIGGFGAPSLDRLLATRPTLILDVDLEDETTASLMMQTGVRRVRVPCATLDEIPAAIITVGRLANCAAAQPLAERIRRAVLERRNAVKVYQASGQTVPTVFAEIWGDPLMTVGRNSFVSELIALAGGRNLGDEVTDKDYFPVSSEWVIARNPDIILCLYMTKAGGGQAPGDERGLNAGKKATTENRKSNTGVRLSGRPGWAQIKAVRDNRVYGGFDNNLILRPGPRVLEGIAALQTCFQNGVHPGADHP